MLRVHAKWTINDFAVVADARLGADVNNPFAILLSTELELGVFTNLLKFFLLLKSFFEFDSERLKCW